MTIAIASPPVCVVGSPEAPPASGGPETAKASGRPEALPVGRATGADQETECRARPPQALSVRLGPRGVNGHRPRLNRLSEAAFREIEPGARKVGSWHIPEVDRVSAKAGTPDILELCCINFRRHKL
jgi:hypothetical protein